MPQKIKNCYYETYELTNYGIKNSTLQSTNNHQATTVTVSYSLQMSP